LPSDNDSINDINHIVSRTELIFGIPKVVKSVFKDISKIEQLTFNYFSETGGGGASHKEVMKLRKENQQISEENNLLKLKIDILLDMASIRAPLSQLRHKQNNTLCFVKKNNIYDTFH
jgi:hypothetical protein